MDQHVAIGIATERSATTRLRDPPDVAREAEGTDLDRGFEDVDHCEDNLQEIEAVFEGLVHAVALDCHADRVEQHRKQDEVVEPPADAA